MFKTFGKIQNEINERLFYERRIPRGLHWDEGRLGTEKAKIVRDRSSASDGNGLWVVHLLPLSQTRARQASEFERN